MSRKLTGHRSEELERYKHFSPAFKQQTIELIAGQRQDSVATFLATPAKNTNTRHKGRVQVPPLIDVNGGADGTRTRELRRDSLTAEKEKVR